MLPAWYPRTVVPSRRSSSPTVPLASMKVPPAPMLATESPSLCSQETVAFTRSAGTPKAWSICAGVRNWW